MTSSVFTRSVHRVVLAAVLATSLGPLGCAGEQPIEGGATSDAATAPLRDLFTDYGPQVGDPIAGSAMPEVQRWEIHQAPEGLTVRGIDGKTGNAVVLYAARYGTNAQGGVVVTAQAVSLSTRVASLTRYTVDSVLQAIKTDIDAAHPRESATDASDGSPDGGLAPSPEIEASSAASSHLRMLGATASTTGCHVFDIVRATIEVTVAALVVGSAVASFFTGAGEAAMAIDLVASRGQMAIGIALVAYGVVDAASTISDCVSYPLASRGVI